MNEKRFFIDTVLFWVIIAYMLVAALGGANIILWLDQREQGRELEEVIAAAAKARKAAGSEQVRSCFRQASSRSSLREIAGDPTVSPTLRSFVHTIYENTPTVRECSVLADRLNVPKPEVR